MWGALVLGVVAVLFPDRRVSHGGGGVKIN